MATATAVDSQRDNVEVFPLTPVPEEEGESAFEAPPVSTITNTTEEDHEEEQVQQNERVQESLTESLPQEEREKLRELLSKTADSSAVKERVFSTQIRPPPTPPQDVSMYTNTRRTARSKNDRERGFFKSDQLVESLLQSHAKRGKDRESEATKRRENATQVAATQASGREFSSVDKYQVPVHVQDDDDSSSDSAKEQPNIISSSNRDKTESPKLRQLLSKNTRTLLKDWLSLFFSADAAQHYFAEYLRRLSQVIGYTFAAIGSIYCIFGFMFLLFAVGGLIGWFIFCAVIVSAVVSCILLLGLVAFVLVSRLSQIKVVSINYWKDY
ncbi:hypothetical protein Gasu2_31790 [Galdieria sulphuraria]|nr:hypothetical protein Gasu2_31790 [Galdieria sulphuraria]